MDAKNMKLVLLILKSIMIFISIDIMVILVKLSLIEMEVFKLLLNLKIGEAFEPFLESLVYLLFAIVLFIVLVKTYTIHGSIKK